MYQNENVMELALVTANNSTPESLACALKILQ